MSSDRDAPETPALTLRTATAEEYCRYALQSRHNEFWWYFNGLAPYQGFSKPFIDGDGRWWYRVKPGFAWPVDFFVPFSKQPAGLSGRPLLGWQWPVAIPAANSKVWMNVIHDLSRYGLDAVAENKRRAIRKGLRELQISAVDAGNGRVCEEALEVWNSHVARTGWNRPMSLDRFSQTWSELGGWPGTTVLAARGGVGDQRMCAWLIVRVIDDTVYIDTLASHTDRLESRPNDTIIFSCLCAAQTQGARRAHYSLKSDISSLEAFKQSMGFEAYPFPARLRLRFPVGTALRLFKPKTYHRLRGDSTMPPEG